MKKCSNKGCLRPPLCSSLLIRPSCWSPSFLCQRLISCDQHQGGSSSCSGDNLLYYALRRRIQPLSLYTPSFISNWLQSHHRIGPQSMLIFLCLGCVTQRKRILKKLMRRPLQFTNHIHTQAHFWRV